MPAKTSMTHLFTKEQLRLGLIKSRAGHLDTTKMKCLGVQVGALFGNVLVRKLPFLCCHPALNKHKTSDQQKMANKRGRVRE